MLRSINNVVENTSEDQENIDPQPNHTLPSSQQASHITQRDNTQIEILRVLQELRRDMQNLRSNPGNSQNNNRNSKSGCKTPDSGGRRRTNISKYCWSHGSCAHDSQNYPKPAPGHQITATFTSKMDGSCTRCE